MEARFTLTTTAEPRPSRRRIAPPVLTVERSPREASRSGVTLEPEPEPESDDDAVDWREWILELRGTFIAKQEAALAAERSRVTALANRYLQQAEASARFRPKATRAAFLAAERAAHDSVFDEAIANMEAKHAATVTAAPVFPDTAPSVESKPGLYAIATSGLGLSLTLLEADGVTMRVQLSGDLALQSRVVDVLHTLCEERRATQAVTS